MFVSIYYVLNCTAKKPRAPKGGHVLAAPLPDGELLTDNHKKQWRIGKPVGSGGFGLLYLGKILTFFCSRTIGTVYNQAGENIEYKVGAVAYKRSFNIRSINRVPTQVLKVLKGLKLIFTN